ncbi:hypothetical protein [Rhizobium sp. CAU 1783]
MIIRRVFFGSGAGGSRLHPIRALLVLMAICIICILTDEYSDHLPALASWILSALAYVSLVIAFGELSLVILGLQGIVSAELAMGRGGFTMPNPFETVYAGPKPLILALCLIAALYMTSTTLLLPFTAFGYNDDRCPQSPYGPYRFALLLINMIPGYDACIKDPSLVYRTVRYIINLAILGTLLARLPAMIQANQK